MFSWFITGLRSTGELTNCLSRVQRVIVVGAGLMSTVAVMVAFRQTPLSALALGAMVAVGAWLSAIDLAVHRLPNVIVGPLTVVVVASLLVAGFQASDLRRSGIALGLGLITSAFFMIGNLFGVIGMGDVKYALPVFAVAAWFGVVAFQVAVMAMMISATVVMIATSIKTRSATVRVAYGPYMALGLTVALLTTGLQS